MDKAEREKKIEADSEDSAKPILHDFKGLDQTKMFTKNTLIIFVIAAILGIGVGYIWARSGIAGGVATMNIAGSAGTTSKTEGSNDLSTFKDTAEGTLQTGGIDGEGQYHLVRPGGDSQNVYLVSSIVDLSKYVGKKIKVWGQTQQAQHAGWLMDVGRVETL